MAYKLDRNNEPGYFRIALLSDIHYDSKTSQKLFNNIVNRVASLKPDYICIPGDLLDESNTPDITLLLEFLKDLAKINKVFISIGNHDLMYINDKKWTKDFNEKYFALMNNIKGVKVLNNSSASDGNINFIGYTAPFEHYEVNRSIDYLVNDINTVLPEASPKDVYNVILCHDPSILKVDDIDRIKVLKNVKLMLSGHMHGGLIHPLIVNLFPQNKGLVSPDREFFPEYARGIVTIGNLTTIISEGVTKLSRTTGILSNFNWLYKPYVKGFDIKK